MLTFPMTSRASPTCIDVGKAERVNNYSTTCYWGCNKCINCKHYITYSSRACSLDCKCAKGQTSEPKTLLGRIMKRLGV